MQQLQLLIFDRSIFLDNMKNNSIHYQFDQLYQYLLQQIYKPIMHNRSYYQKQQGFIIRRKNQQASQSSRRNLSHDIAPTNHSTLNSEYDKYPGEIRKAKKEDNGSIQKIDQEVYYNSDLYYKYEVMKRPSVKYEEVQHVAIQVRRSPSKQQKEHKQSHQSQQKQEQSSRNVFDNIHDRFQLNKFQQVYHLLRNIIASMQINEIQVLKSIKLYIHFATKQNIDNTNGLRFIPSKRQLLKQSFAIQRQAVLVICFAIAINRFQILKSYCSNLLMYAFQNHLLSLNLLTQGNNQLVEQLLIENNKEHLKGKGFEDIRSNNQLMRSLIIKISKSDPLFSEQFCKIIQNYSSQSVKTELYSILTLFSFYLYAIKAVEKVPFLSASPGPFILEQPTKQYTLVIDFVKIFIDNSVSLQKQLKRDQYSLRPYTQYFLHELQKYFEIISFSDLLPIECNKIISKIDERRCVKYKLYKYHIDYEIKRKEVQKIGRDLDRIILLDTIESLKTDNLLLINPWKGQKNDAILAEICPLLAMIVVKKLSVLDSLKKIKQASSRNATLGLKYINCGLNL